MAHAEGVDQTNHPKILALHEKAKAFLISFTSALNDPELVEAATASAAAMMITITQVADGEFEHGDGCGCETQPYQPVTGGYLQ